LLSFPVTLQFPRAARRIRGEVILQRVSSLLVQKKFFNPRELKIFYKNDLKELRRLQGFLVQREIEQAELFVRIRKFHGSFPPGAYEKLVARLKNEEARRAVSAQAGQAVSDPRQDPLYARDYAIVELFKKSAEILAVDGKMVGLRPSERALRFVEAITDSNDQQQMLVVRRWEPVVRRYVQWSYDWMGVVNKAVAFLRQPIVTYSGVLIILGSLGTGATWAYRHVYRPAHDYVLYDSEQMKARNYYETIVGLRKSISDVSVTYRDFYTRFFDWAQANYSDEAITVAFEYLRKTRPVLEATKKLDGDFTPEQLASFTRQAKEIVAIRDALLYGYDCKYGRVSAVSPRLFRRGRNYYLTQEIWKSEMQGATNFTAVLPNFSPPVRSNTNDVTRE
jgi:hypothetical protein